MNLRTLFCLKFKHLLPILGLCFLSVTAFADTKACSWILKTDHQKVDALGEPFAELKSAFAQYKRASNVLAVWKFQSTEKKQKLFDLVQENYETVVRAKNDPKSPNRNAIYLKRIMDVVLTDVIQKHDLGVSNKSGLETYKRIYELDTKLARIRHPIEFTKMIEFYRALQDAMNDKAYLMEKVSELSSSPNRHKPGAEFLKETWSAADRLYVSLKRGGLPENIKIMAGGSAVVGRGVRESSDIDLDSSSDPMEIIVKQLVAQHPLVKKAARETGIREVSDVGILIDESNNYQSSLLTFASVEVTGRKITLLVNPPGFVYDPIRIEL